LVVQPRRDALGVTDEGLHLRLAKGAAASASKTAAEAFRAGNAERRFIEFKRRAFAFEHHRAGALQLLAHAVMVIAMVIVITKYDNHGNLHDGEFFGQRARLLAFAV